MATKTAPTGTKPSVKAPTPKQFQQGAKVSLTRPGWTNHSWTPHGFLYPIDFDAKGNAVVLKSHYDLWIGDDRAYNEGMTVTPVAKPATNRN